MNARRLYSLVLLLLTPIAWSQVPPEQDPSYNRTLVSGGAPSLAWGDYDADGILDALAIAGRGEPRLLRGLGDGSFEDVSLAAGIAPSSGVHSARWADYDGDSRLDLFLAAYGGESLLLRQDSGGVFVAANEAAGLAHHADVLAAEWIDYDVDGLADLHVVTVTDDVLYHHLGAGTFESVELGLERTPFPGATTRPLTGVDLAGDSGGDQFASGGATSGPPSGAILPMVACASAIDDFANPGICIAASVVGLEHARGNGEVVVGGGRPGNENVTASA